MVDGPYTNSGLNRGSKDPSRGSLLHDYEGAFPRVDLESLRPRLWTPDRARLPIGVLTPINSPLILHLPEDIERKLQALYTECFKDVSDVLYAGRAVALQPQALLAFEAHNSSAIYAFRRGLLKVLEAREGLAERLVSHELRIKAEENVRLRGTPIAARSIAWLAMNPPYDPDDRAPEFRLYCAVDCIRGLPPVSTPGEVTAGGVLSATGFERTVIAAVSWDARPAGDGLLPAAALPPLIRHAHPLLDVTMALYRSTKHVAVPYSKFGLLNELAELLIPMGVPGIATNTASQKNPSLYTPTHFRVLEPIEIAYEKDARLTPSLHAFVRAITPFMALARGNSTSPGPLAAKPPASKGHVAAALLWDKESGGYTLVNGVNWKDQYSYQSGCAESVVSGQHDSMGGRYELRALVIGSNDYLCKSGGPSKEPHVCAVCCGVLADSPGIAIRSDNDTPAPGNDVLLIRIVLPDDPHDEVPDRLPQVVWLSQMKMSSYAVTENSAISGSRASLRDGPR